MTAYAALLRAVNLAGHNQVSMADLRELLSRLGFQDGRSLLQSGNLVFRSDLRSAAPLESLLESETAKRLGLQTAFFVRSAADWRAVVERNPFPKEAARDPRRLAVMFLKDKPAAKHVDALRAAITGREQFRAEGRQLYVVYPDGFARTRFTTTLIEKKLGTRSTGRNWNTVLRLQAALEE